MRVLPNVDVHASGKPTQKSQRLNVTIYCEESIEVNCLIVSIGGD